MVQLHWKENIVVNYCYYDYCDFYNDSKKEQDLLTNG